LAELWGYASFHAIARGVVTPRDDNKIILFVTEEKQSSTEQYVDRLSGSSLNWEGPTDHFAEKRMLNAVSSGDKIHLFHRKQHRTDSIYCGRLSVASHILHTDRSSLFTFMIVSSEVPGSQDGDELIHGRVATFTVPTVNGSILNKSSSSYMAAMLQQIELQEAGLSEALRKLEALQVAPPAPAEILASASVPALPDILAWLATQERVSLAVLRSHLLPLDLLPSAVIDEINERALDLIGDVVFEEVGKEIIIAKEVLFEVLTSLE